MSQYFNFYLAKKDEKGKFNFVAPFIRVNGQFKPKSLLTCSRSFIDQGEFIAMAECNIALDDMDEYLYKLCNNTGFFSEQPYSTGYAIPYQTMLAESVKGGLYRGYVSPEDLTFLVANDFKLEDRWSVNLIPAEVVAEQGKGDLVNATFIAVNDTSYYADTLVRAVSEIVPFERSMNQNYYFVFETEY